MYSFLSHIECKNKPHDFDTVLKKDACYHAFGISCSALRTRDEVIFSDFFWTFCVPEFNAGNPLLQRRIASVIIGWSSEIYGVDEKLEDMAYSAFQLFSH